MIDKKHARPSLTPSMAIGLLSIGTLLCSSGGALAAGNVSIRGVVTDHAGKPVRGAIVKAMQGDKLIARYTDADGKYLIQGLAAGSRDVSVTAFGFASAIARSSDGKADFKLKPELDLHAMTTADMRYLLPESKDQLRVFYECGSCHGLELPLSRTGMPTPAWQGFLEHMTTWRWGFSNWTPQRSAKAAPEVNEVFGPEGTLGPNAKPDLTKIKHVPLSDAALKATITEYMVPSRGAQPHSIRVDAKTGRVWFANYDAQSNNVYQFNPQTESFKESKIPLPSAAAHTGAILKDGSYLIALDAFDPTPVKAARVSPDGQLRTVEWSGRPKGTRVAAADPSNPDIVWLIAGKETWRLDIKTNQFRAYQNPTPPSTPKGSHAERFYPGAPYSDGYDVAVDPKGTAWVSQLYQGVIFSIDPESGVTKLYHTPEMASARGLVSDAAGNIWFADYYGHKLGMLDTTTGSFSMYYPPNKYATPYGLAVDYKRGYIWYADTMPNKVTRFDPKTKQFIEYELPTPHASARFVGVDAQGRAWYGGFFNSRLGVIDPGDDTAGARTSGL